MLLQGFMFFTYILFSDSLSKYYIGYTSDLDSRVARHNSGGSRYTKRGIPWRLVYFESFETKSEAISHERFLKRQKNRAFYERLISGFDSSLLD